MLFSGYRNAVIMKNVIVVKDNFYKTEKLLWNQQKSIATKFYYTLIAVLLYS